MNLKKIDFFSYQFQFDFGKNNQKKGTTFGAILSIFLIIIVLTYSSYLFYQYLSNQINPKYASQSFVTENSIDIDLSEDLIGFRYEYGVNLNIDDLQDQQNQTYLVFIPYFYFQNGRYFELIPLNYSKCTNHKLEGFNCIDFSTVKNYTLTLSTKDNIFSNIYLFVYQCQDTDMTKTFVPNNCANQLDIDNIINNPYASLRLKLYTSQYNTSSQQSQYGYRNSYVYLQGEQFQLYTFKTQKQVTYLKKGAIIQDETRQKEDEDQSQKENFQSIFIPSFDTKSIKSADNSVNGIQNKVFNQQNKIQNQISQENNNSQSQFQDYKQKVNTLKSQETSQEKLYLPLKKINSLKKIQNVQQEILQNQIKVDHSQTILKISDYYKKVLETIQNNFLMKKIKNTIYKTRFFRRKEYLKSLGLDPIHKNIIEDQVNSNLDILEIYKDLLLVKKAVLMLLSKDQLAALQLIGLSSCYMQFKSEDENKKNQLSFNTNNLSHLEEQFCLLKYSALQQQYINSFFNRICNNKNITDLDQRIFSSLQ
ncbi:AMP-binding enzyme family protein (macronuclear) [Tetrahymena thermophila SB210]|uniref:AMP-binding enzyme family protein n=1 Tax=Tetrahymena thermophila (strain SB210) TaxID=312017 RepID=W7XEM6_TETTS|nr:AMP-binding enzyme family protein [Tetrahymena thermophila SB210]EWS75168.1 AMP-binding enzyme family protein [Tetrahymena thermophila SB210]|eukprot:XP_012652324.1 AMP-binding enzyme family protein [Tetrahymena thermophila SB210]